MYTLGIFIYAEDWLALTEKRVLLGVFYTVYKISSSYYSLQFSKYFDYSFKLALTKMSSE